MTCRPIDLRNAIVCICILALSACGGSGGSGPGTPSNPPAAPSGLVATSGDTEVALSWNSVGTATSYSVYWSDTSGVTQQTGTRISSATSPHTVPSLTNGNAYYFVVTASNAQGESPDSAETSATPQIPAPGQVSGVTATPQAGAVQLSWGAVASATSYNLYWSASAGVTPQNGNRISGVSSPHSVPSLSPGTTYYFVVTAVNAGGEGQASAETNAMPSAPVSGWSAQEVINVPFDFFDTDLYLGDVDINDVGMAAAVWEEEGSDRDTARVKVNLYVNGAWGTPETLAGPSAFSPSVVVAPNGVVTVCYLLRGFNPDMSWLNATVWSRRYEGGSWSAAEQIDGIDLTVFTFMHGMDMSVDSSGNVVASWIQDNSTIWANQFNVASGTWGTATSLSNSVRSVQEPALGVDGLGNCTVVWLQDTKPYDPGQSAGGPSNPVLHQSRYSGGAWGTSTSIGHTDILDWESAERVDLAVNSDGTVVAVWEQTRSAAGGGSDWSVDTVRYDYLTDTWGAPETIYSQSIYTSWPDVAIDSSGNAIAAWQPTDPVDNNQRIASASFYDAATSSWGAVESINVDDGLSEVYELSVGKGASGETIAVWMQGGEIKARHYDPVADSWGNITPIGLRDGIDLKFAMSSSGRAIAISNPLDTGNIPWTRDVWANIFTP